jgi:hypothetical protein
MCRSLRYICHRLREQGCQMVYFQNKNPNLCKIWRALNWKMLTYFMAVWNILRTFGILYDHFADFVFIWYIIHVSCAYQENLATLDETPRKRFLPKIWKISRPSRFPETIGSVDIFSAGKKNSFEKVTSTLGAHVQSVFGTTLFCRSPICRISKCRNSNCPHRNGE